jgi:hypothetical protein
MNAPITLPGELSYARPLFRPGQILPDTALTALGCFAAAHLDAAARRSGWGVVKGLAPRILRRNGMDFVHISPGVAVDQAGRTIIIETTPDDGDPLQAFIAGQHDAEFDLWLTIKTEPYGAVIPWRNVGVGAPSPVGESLPDALARFPRERPVARLAFRPADELDGLLQQREEAYTAFAEAFADAEQHGDIDQIQAARLKLLADALQQAPPRYKGIPLGRISVDPASRTPRADFDLSYARMEARDALPAPADHVNLAPVLGMKASTARAWLAAHGFQPWTEQTVSEIEVTPPYAWNLALRPGDTIRLFTRAGRVAVVKEGPMVAEELSKLDHRLNKAEAEISRLSTSVVLLFLILIVLGLVLLSAWMEIDKHGVQIEKHDKQINELILKLPK